jgi:hypothetical protein
MIDEETADAGPLDEGTAHEGVAAENEGVGGLGCKVGPAASTAGRTQSSKRTSDQVRTSSRALGEPTRPSTWAYAMARPSVTRVA